MNIVREGFEGMFEVGEYGCGENVRMTLKGNVCEGTDNSDICSQDNFSFEILKMRTRKGSKIRSLIFKGIYFW